MLAKEINEYNKDTLSTEEFGDHYRGRGDEDELSTASAPPPPPAYNPEFESYLSTSAATVVSAPAAVSPTASAPSDDQGTNTQKPEVHIADETEKESTPPSSKETSSENMAQEGQTEREPESNSSNSSTFHNNAILVAVMQFFILLGWHTQRVTRQVGKKAIELNEKHQFSSKAKESVTKSAAFVQQSSIRARDNVVELGKKHEVCPKVQRATKTVKRGVQKASETTVQASIRVRDMAVELNEKHQICPKVKYTARMVGRQVKRASKATVKSVREYMDDVKTTTKQPSAE